jgi:ribonuclease HI
MSTDQKDSVQDGLPDQVIHVFTDGTGARPDGKGSGFAWLRPDTGERQIIREDGLTNNQAEYRGVILALESLPIGAAVEIRTDSEVICEQLRGQYKVRDPKLIVLWTAVQDVIGRKNLRVRFIWVPREENPAGKLF